MSTEADKTNTGVVTTIVVVGTFAMIAISALVAAMVRAEYSDVDQRRPVNADLETVAQLDRDQRAKLEAAPAWIDREKQKVSIPIDLAMKVVLDEYAKKPEAASPTPPPGLVMNPVPGTPGAGAAPVPDPATGAATTPAGAPPTGVVPAAVVPRAVTPAAPPASAPAVVPRAAPPAAVPPAPAPSGAQGESAPPAAPRAPAQSGDAPPAGAVPAPAKPSAAPATPKPAAPAPSPTTPPATPAPAEPSGQP
jgi:hypothetical protein